MVKLLSPTSFVVALVAAAGIACAAPTHYLAERQVTSTDAMDMSTREVLSRSNLLNSRESRYGAFERALTDDDKYLPTRDILEETYKRSMPVPRMPTVGGVIRYGRQKIADNAMYVGKKGRAIAGKIRDGAQTIYNNAKARKPPKDRNSPKDEEDYPAREYYEDLFE